MSKMTAHITQDTYTIQEAAMHTGLSEHTLRYYERVRLIAPVQRDGSSKHRRYTSEDLRALEFLKRLRATGMPIHVMQKYVALFLEGDRTLEERRAMLLAHKQRVLEQIADLQAHLAVIEFKIENYERLEVGLNTDADRCLEVRKDVRNASTTET